MNHRISRLIRSVKYTGEINLFVRMSVADRGALTLSQKIVADDVAVIVVNYNGGEYLPRCLAALYALEQLPGEIIVVDNASEDDSLAAAKRAYADIQTIECASNTGFAAANNTGIAATEKPWVALINPDAFVKTDWLTLLLSTMNTSTAKFFSSQLINANDRSLFDGQGDCYHVSGLVWRRRHGQALSTGNSQLPMFSPCAASAVYQREAVLAVGGFDESYFCYNEDIDLGFRLRLAGYDCEHIPTAITYHIGSGITKRESDFSIYHGHRNLVWTYFKNMPTKLFWRYLPQHLLMNIVSLVYYSLKGRPRVIFRAKWHALKGLSDIWAKRVETNAVSDERVRSNMTGGWLRPYFKRYE